MSDDRQPPAASSSGRTPDFESGNSGSNLGAATNSRPMKLLATTDMRIVSMVEFRGKLYLACENAVYVHDPAKGEFDFEEMHLVHLPPEVAS